MSQDSRQITAGAAARLLPGLLVVALAACGGKTTDSTPPGPSSAAPVTTASANVHASASAMADFEEDGPPGDAAKGKALVAKFECNRCHEGTGEPEPKLEKHCFRCHEEILTGKFKPPNAKIGDRWKDLVAPYRDVPSLAGSKHRFKRNFIAHFLEKPYDVRPRLASTMPRLAISKEEARDIGAYLGLEASDKQAEAKALEGANLEHGRKLMEEKGCPTCHLFTGVPKMTGAPEKLEFTGIAKGMALAPDFRTTRKRMPPDVVMRWIKSPKAIKPDTEMPEFALSDADNRDLAAYIVKAELAKEEPKAIAARLPLLTRKVTYDEVSTKIFRRTCWHCHGEPDYSVGDGGPGNTGGLGFKPRGLALTDYANVASGFLDDKGERHSAFEKLKDGTPRMLAALIARQEEESGKVNAEVRGMPLGYPSLPPEEIQLLESWIDQGRPR